MEVIEVAQQVITRYTDDLDGSEASGKVEFSLDGRSYEIDLNDDNAGRLRDTLAPFIAAARRAGRGRAVPSASQPARSGSGRSREEIAEMRAWLRFNGYEVSDRGRISSDLIQAFETKTPLTAPPRRSPRRRKRSSEDAEALAE
jgi:hypothetical protein